MHEMFAARVSAIKESMDRLDRDIEIFKRQRELLSSQLATFQEASNILEANVTPSNGPEPNPPASAPRQRHDRRAVLRDIFRAKPALGWSIGSLSEATGWSKPQVEMQLKRLGEEVFFDGGVWCWRDSRLSDTTMRHGAVVTVGDGADAQPTA